MCDLCCCFSDADLSQEECEKQGYAGRTQAHTGSAHPFSFECQQEHRERFQIPMKRALCESPCCCILTCVTGTYGTNWCLRRAVLEAEWKRYYCCQGFAPCCQKFCDGLVCCEEDGRAVCMCLECLFCPGLAISATRLHLMAEFHLKPDKSDNQIIRFNNCVQVVACICDVLAMFIRPLRPLARCVDLFAHLVFCCTAGCMAGQIVHEKDYQLALEAQGGHEKAYLYSDNQTRFVMAPPGEQGPPSYSTHAVQPEYGAALSNEENPQA